jgi:hypothetical protein
MGISEHIRTFHEALAKDEHHRYRSWEHCYGFFRRVGPLGIVADPDIAAIQLGFYLASWGMYRPRGFLLRKAYTVHIGAVKCLTMPLFAPLWQTEFGSSDGDAEHVPLIDKAIETIRLAYKPFHATDTLVTKVLLGTLGCLPAWDRLFLKGLKKSGEFKYSGNNGIFISRILDFCRKNAGELQLEQARIKAESGVYYPPMKLADMYFWQMGN